MDFTIRALGYGRLPITNEIPSELAQYYIPGSEIMSASAPFGKFLIQLIKLDGFSWSYSIFKVEEDVSFLVSSFTPLLLCRIALQGNSVHEVKSIGTLLFKESQFNIFHCSSLNDSFALKKGKEYFSVAISYPVDYVLHVLKYFPLLEEFHNNLKRFQPVLLTASEIYADATIIDLIYKLVHSPYSSSVRSFHVDIIKDLLFKMLKQASDTRDHSQKFLVSEVERIYAAKEFIESKLPEHFSIYQIARHVGMNEQKLKKGFKEIFGTGMYAYLQEEILKIAKNEVEQTNRSIKEIAYHAGYRDANNFTAAFKKKYGISPLHWRNNLKRQNAENKKGT